jgi:hypothetical protein
VLDPAKRVQQDTCGQSRPGSGSALRHPQSAPHRLRPLTPDSPSVFAAAVHTAVKATWGAYHRLASAHRHGASLGCWLLDRTGTSNYPTEGINAQVERLCGTALGFRNLTHYMTRSPSTPAASDSGDILSAMSHETIGGQDLRFSGNSITFPLKPEVLVSDVLV